MKWEEQIASEFLQKYFRRKPCYELRHIPLLCRPSLPPPPLSFSLSLPAPVWFRLGRPKTSRRHYILARNATAARRNTLLAAES